MGLTIKKIWALDIKYHVGRYIKELEADYNMVVLQWLWIPWEMPEDELCKSIGAQQTVDFKLVDGTVWRQSYLHL